jgi:hypothetical protein
MKYRRKSGIIEAVQWDGTNGNALEKLGCRTHIEEGISGQEVLYLETIEGGILGVSIGDYIIRDHGKFTCYAPAIFERMYEEVVG